MKRSIIDQSERPFCKVCGSGLLRWSWFEWPGEDFKYWYCLECDKAGREPCIFFVRERRNEMAGWNFYPKESCWRYDYEGKEGVSKTIPPGIVEPGKEQEPFPVSKEAVTQMEMPENKWNQAVLPTATDDPWRGRSYGMRCRTCMWFVEKIHRFGRCRRHAPTLGGFPAVYDNDWCGDHKMNEEKI